MISHPGPCHKGGRRQWGDCMLIYLVEANVRLNLSPSIFPDHYRLRLLGQIT